WVRHRAEGLLRDADFLRATGIAEKAPVSVTVERAGKETRFAVPLAGSAVPKRDPPHVRFELDPDNDLGIFVLDSCINDDLYQKTLKQFFDGVREKKIGRVAVDLRRNGGGNSWVANEFLRYVDVEDYKLCGGVVRWSDEYKARLTGLAKMMTLVDL